VKGSSTLVTLLNELAKKDAPFIRGEKQGKTFQNLKDKLTHTSILVSLDFSKTFELECDASKVGIGEMLLQGGILLHTLVRNFVNPPSTIPPMTKSYML